MHLAVRFNQVDLKDESDIVNVFIDHHFGVAYTKHEMIDTSNCVLDIHFDRCCYYNEKYIYLSDCISNKKLWINNKLYTGVYWI